MTLLETVVEWNLFEVDLAGFPESFLTLLFLAGKELCDISVVALGNILVPALLHLVALHVIYIFNLKNSVKSTIESIC